MNWDYPIEIVPAKMHYRLIAVAFVCGLAFRVAFFPLMFVLSQSLTETSLVWTWLLVLGLPCFVIGLLSGFCFYRSLQLPYAAMKMSTWAGVFAIPLFAVPVPEAILIAVISFVAGLPFIGVLFMALGTWLGLLARHSLLVRAARKM